MFHPVEEVKGWKIVKLGDFWTLNVIAVGNTWKRGGEFTVGSEPTCELKWLLVWSTQEKKKKQHIWLVLSALFWLQQAAEI